MPTFQHAIGQGRASCGGGHHCFGSKTKAMAEMMCAWRREADSSRNSTFRAVRSDVAAATGPCGHANVEIYGPLRRHLPTCPTLKHRACRAGRFEENSGCKVPASSCTPVVLASGFRVARSDPCAPAPAHHHPLP